ncbi:hypothetical protein [Neolewinella agarilytica]|uniref:Tat (Twin-arginine translocation) pathway signal sequence n=1 Tax=Neolewinella agarilytica TaxID=478744 RepID=A0A1H9NBS2_9BACT|nr:hypothetical protein [Neolewinella agarilytica]SER32813.1 hypothetical protein SAMN05444359_13524 [Neolewinella agarilytica]
MNRRKFITKGATLTLGLSIPALVLAKSTPSLKAEEVRMVNEFHQLLNSYPYSGEVTASLCVIRKINYASGEVLDFEDDNGNRISLRKKKGRLVARLH